MATHSNLVYCIPRSRSKGGFHWATFVATGSLKGADMEVPSFEFGKGEVLKFVWSISYFSYFFVDRYRRILCATRYY